MNGSVAPRKGLHITLFGKIVLVVLTAAIFSAIGLAAANATILTPANQPAGDVHACVKSSGAVDFLQFRTANYGKCATGDAPWQWARTDGTAPKALASSNTAIAPNSSVNYGGSFVTQATELGSITLHPGTYLITVDVKAAPNAGTGAATVFPQVFLYNQTKNAAFDGDVANFSSVFENGVNSNIDTYVSGSVSVTITQDTTYHIYGDGYASDQSGGTYKVEAGSNIQVLSES